ncbi:MAG: oligopeptidase A [Burkholderiales bacterium RIFOXYC12_FULL_65_23]|uniref:M3 family metallopeptidase n=1 Tax=Malikia spinosa TaxID=86180 RepID=UPI0008B21B9C|nr:M3 family metallopeptidase [Malikia spinosa]OGB68833.1 MAG: oligopeptidase A [Burkholderiales bacterium RIFOXYC12_FULL_65_23]
MNATTAPESAALLDAANPLLDFTDLPLFDAIRPEQVEPAIDSLLQAAAAALELVTAADFAADWQAMALVLDVATERLGRAWGAVSHLNSVADTPELRAAYNAALPKVTEFWTRLGADERLYAKYKAMDPARLNAEQIQARTNALRGFVLGGAELQGEAKERFAAIQERQAELGQKFSENALDATDAWTYYASADELDGVPADTLAATRAAAEAEGKEGHKLTLKLPCYLPLMQFGRNRALREKLYRAYGTRASEQAEGEAVKFDNSAIIRELLALRQEEATLLGYPHFAAVSLVPKMAESAEQVVAFLRELSKKARPYAERDLADMRAFAAETLGLTDPQAWDWPYIGEQLRQARYAYSEQDVKPYFTAPKVLEGLFKIVETLFEVQIRADQAPVWHPGVKFFRLERAGQLIGQFYLDPGARSGKRGGAWMDDVRARWLRPDDAHLQTPVAQLVCNFSEAVGDKPALLTHDDVITLFHEFGHGLHHLLTQIQEHDVSGISGVEWDAVELPSQFMENFCWEWDVLSGMTAHVDTGAPLPRELFDKMLAAKNFQSGLQTLRQIEFSLFDMLLHSGAAADGDFMALQQQVRDEVALIQPPAYSRTPHTFSHIFAGGYAAGYYSYKWAEVLSADAYAAFEEAAPANGGSTLDIETGRRFRRELLEVGGSRPAMDSFKAFRGREPALDALLRHQGMAD